MKSKMKRFLSLFLCFVMLVGLFPNTVFAADIIASGFSGDDITWKLDAEGTLTFFGEDEIWYSNWDFYNNKIKKVIINEGITRIGSYIFADCYNLTSIELPDSLYIIDDYAFEGCTSLTSIVIPEGVYDIGYHTFDGCTNLEGIWVDEENDDFSSDARGVLYNKDKSELIKIPGTLSGEYIIPASVSYIYYNSVSECRNITAIWVDNNNQEYSNDEYGSLFNKEKTELYKVPNKHSGNYTVPNGVTYIGDYAFTNCSSLINIYIPDSVSDIDSVDYEGYTAFDGCARLKGIWVDENNPYYSSDEYGVLFSEYDGEYREVSLLKAPGGLSGSYTVPDDVSLISTYAFANCLNLNSITIPTLKYGMYNDCLYGCVNLDTIIFLGDEPGCYGDDGWPDHALDLYGITATVYYPNTWEYVWIMGGGENITWIEYEVENDENLVKNGDFRYNAMYEDATYPYYYNENWFVESTTKYNHDLAKMSLRAAIAAYGTGSNSDGSEYIAELMGELEFDNVNISYPTPKRDTIGYAIGSKTINTGEGKKSLVMVAIRGGGYGAEWGGNFMIGNGDIHSGFSTAATKVENGLKQYLKTYDGELQDDCIVWVVGYSRAAATANLLAKRLDDGNVSGLGRDNVFAYCFECPRNSRASNLTNSRYDNIMNIVNPLDFVTMVAMEDWDYGRYGKTYYLPYEEGVENYGNLKYKMIQEYIDIIGTNNGDAFEATLQIAGQKDLTEGFISWLAEEFTSPWSYSLWYQESLVEVIESFQGDGWQLSDTLDVIVVLVKLGLIAKNALSLPKNPFDLIDRVSQMEDDLYATMTLELLLFGVLDTGSFNKTTITYTHYPELCLAWLDSLEGETGYVNSKYRRVFINCPVNVNVYNSEDVLVGSIVNGEVEEIENGISLYVDMDDQIVVSLPNTEEYRIEIDATDEGTVTYTVAEHDIETGSDDRVVSYLQVEVENGDELVGIVEELNETETAAYSLSYNDTELTPTVDQAGDNVEEYSVTCVVEGNGEVTGGGSAAYGEYRKFTAVPDDGEVFYGWYVDNKLVSTDEEYRFCVVEDTTLTAKFSVTVTHLVGDVNEDGSITNADLIMIARYIVGLDNSISVKQYGDMNSDGQITNADLIALARIIVGL